MKRLSWLLQALCAVETALVCVVCITYLADRYCDETAVDSQSWSDNGEVALRLGSKTYWFAPNVARAIGEDFILSADECEGGAP